MANGSFVIEADTARAIGLGAALLYCCHRLLQAITDRGKIEVEQYSAREEAIEVQGPRRLFKMPDEIVAESGVA